MNTNIKENSLKTNKKAQKSLNIIIFGATGATGRSLVVQALAAGHKVRGFDRNVSNFTQQHPDLTLVQGDVFDTKQVEEAIAGQDVVICVLGVRPGVTIPVCSRGTENIVAAMKKTGVRRLICQSSFAVAALDGGRREVPWALPLIMPFFPRNKTMMADKVIQERHVRESGLDWIIVRPAQLTATLHTGNYQVGVPLKFGIRSKIAREDVADFILKQVADDRYLGQTVRIRY